MAHVAEALHSTIVETYIILYKIHHPMFVSFAASGFALDLVITVVMCWLLHENRTKDSATSTLTNKLASIVSNL
jgi:hypothetical protein